MLPSCLAVAPLPRTHHSSFKLKRHRPTLSQCSSQLLQLLQGPYNSTLCECSQLAWVLPHLRALPPDIEIPILPVDFVQMVVFTRWVQAFQFIIPTAFLNNLVGVLADKPFPFEAILGSVNPGLSNRSGQQMAE